MWVLGFGLLVGCCFWVEFCDCCFCLGCCLGEFVCVDLGWVCLIVLVWFGVVSLVFELAFGSDGCLFCNVGVLV